MKNWQRVAIAVALLAADLLLFWVPLTAILAVYVLFVRPRWFLESVQRLYRTS